MSFVAILLRRQPHDRRALQDVDRAVGCLPHFADALLLIGEQLFLGDDALAVEHEAHEVLAGHRADEQVALPLGEQSPV